MRRVEVVRTLPKERFLPSLLDRLTDDDPINISIDLQKKRITKLEKELTTLLGKQQQEEQNKKQAQSLQQQLDLAHAQYNILITSISSLTEIRACVKRDLDWLLNASQYELQSELQGCPDVANSVVNFGLPDLTGKTVSGIDMRTMERILKQSIINFEPRIIKKTLNVRILVDKSMFDHNAVCFEIEGQLWAEPEPLYLHLRTEFELESGEVSVYDFEKDTLK